MTQSMATASIASSSLPVSRGSVVDSELADLIHHYPQQTRAYLEAQFGYHKETGPANQTQNHLARVPFNGRSNYQETYLPKAMERVDRPRQPKVNYVPPQIPMETVSKQRDDFKKLDSSYFQRELQHAKSNNSTQITHDPLWSSDLGVRTSYQDDYKQKEAPKLWQETTPSNTKSRNRLKLEVGDVKMDSTTVTKEDFKSPWVEKDVNPLGPRIRFGELPTFAASLIFPKEMRDDPLESTTRKTYKNPHDLDTCHTMAEAAKPPDSNLKLTGEQEFLTTQRQSYTNEIFRDWDKMRPPLMKANKETVVNDKAKREKLHSETQFSSDYKPYSNLTRPRYVRVMTSEFNLFDKDNTFAPDHFDTSTNAYKSVTSASYPGYDVRQYPLRKSFKKESEKYVPPVEKFSTETVTHSAFQPIDVSKVNTSKIVKRERNLQLAASKQPEFEGTSYTHEVYKDWSKHLQPRIRHGDLLEVCNYMPPPPEKAFMGKSETKEAFTPRSSEMPYRAKKPEEESTHLWEQDQQENPYSTVYRKSYMSNKPKYHLSKAQADELKKELMKIQLPNT